MKRLLNPYWIFATITFPQIALILLYLASYQIIKSLLNPENLYRWIEYGGILALFTLLSTGYAFSRMSKRQSVQPLFGLVVLLAYSLFLYFFAYNSHLIIPAGIPNWMFLDGDLQLYAYTFLMPALVYGMLLMVLYFTPETEDAWIGANVLFIFLIPFLWYFIINVMPFLHPWKIFEIEAVRHAGTIFFISNTIAFLLLLARVFYVLVSRNEQVFRENRLIWQVPLVIICPILGLAINNDQFFLIFGDFRAIEFYAIALANGIFVCLPNTEKPFLRLLLFFARSIGYTYILYFFLVLLPFLPLSIPAIVVFGAGFLMLSPLAVTIIQGQLLAEDFQFLQKIYGNGLSSAIFVMGLLILPSSLCFNYWQDRQNLHQALDFVYEPDFTKPSPHISLSNLKNTLDNIKKNKNRRGGGDIFDTSKEHQQPFLTAFYRWYVLDNLTLSDAKIDLLSNVFLTEMPSKTEVRANLVDTAKSNNTLKQAEVQTVDTTKLKADSVFTETKFDAQGKYFRTWVHLQIHNRQSFQQEYTTQFTLPTGTWVSNYYLNINGKREYGLLAEKKSAQWIYQQILSVNRDPGILSYLTGNQLSLRVFPFAPKETRQTGIELIHREPISFSIDNQTISLGEKEKIQNAQVFENQELIYIPASLKKQLPRVELKPYYHILVDVSSAGKGKADFYIQQIEKLQKDKMIPAQNLQISLLNYRLEPLDMKADWRTKIKNLPYKAGFFLEYAIKKNYLDNYLVKKSQVPIIIVLSEKLDKAIFTGDLLDYQFAFANNTQYFAWEAKKGAFSTHSFSQNTDNQLITQLPKTFALTYPNAQNPKAYLADNEESEIILKSKNLSNNLIINDLKSDWNSALALHSQYLAWRMNPQETTQRWLNLVKASFQTKVLNPVTSYISLENEAQKQTLLEKQKRVLAAKSSLDALDEELRAMDEPEFYWFILLLGFLLVWKFRYNS